MAASEGNILIPLYSYRKIKPQRFAWHYLAGPLELWGEGGMCSLITFSHVNEPFFLFDKGK